MTLLDEICAISRAASPRIVLSEGEDARVIEAALQATTDGLAKMVLIGDDWVIRSQLTGKDGGDGIEIIDPRSSDKLDAYTQAYFELRKHKGVDLEKARGVMQGGLGFAAMMVRQGDADGTIGGAVATTADTVRTALQVVGKAPDATVVSSCFIMVLKEPFDRPVAFGDCALNIQPSSEELASIAIASAQTLKAVTGVEPRVALLSFSTAGSASVDAHESIGRIRGGVEIIKQRQPDLIVDGEIQFDAAIIPAIAERKAPDSAVQGQANVFVFPDLSAGNIGYKIAERVGGAMALGPILQGLARPANDLSRGCSVQDIYQLIAITGAQAAAQLGTGKA
ncbi:MAG: phosphate acetyltransferase [Alphaproteobacteria bacterium]|nr:phosphate acetyltransferase [Alphaproteobacteria bacterium]